MITPEHRKKLEEEAEAFEGTGYGIYLSGAEALDRLLSNESACVTGCKSFTGGEIRHHKDCAHYPESFSKMYDELETRLQSEASESDEEAANRWRLDNVSFTPDGPDYEEAFLAGCARYRPIVEEMLIAVKYIVKDAPDTGHPPKEIIARAERLLSTKDGKEE